MTTLTKVRQKHIWLMHETYKTLNNILQDVNQETATTYRDGPDGWTTLEVVCHLRDFDQFFYERAIMMIEQENPELPAYDHEALVIERAYNSQNLKQTMAELGQSRQRFVDFFKGLTADQWARTGIHPTQGEFSLTDSLMQVGLHDTTHIEQITRILTQVR